MPELVPMRRPDRAQAFDAARQILARRDPLLGAPIIRQTLDEHFPPQQGDPAVVDEKLKAKVLKAIHDLQHSGTPAVTDTGLAASLLQRDPSLRPESMDYTAWLNLVRELAKESGAFKHGVEHGQGEYVARAALSLVETVVSSNISEERRQQVVAQMLGEAPAAPPAAARAMQLSMNPPPTVTDERAAQVVAELLGEARPVSAALALGDDPSEDRIDQILVGNPALMNRKERDKLKALIEKAGRLTSNLGRGSARNRLNILVQDASHMLDMGRRPAESFMEELEGAVKAAAWQTEGARPEAS